MFYVEEDVQPVANVVTKELGPVGNMIWGTNVMKNVNVQCNEFGKVWYGDFEGSGKQLDAILVKLTNTTGYTLSYTVD